MATGAVVYTTSILTLILLAATLGCILLIGGILVGFRVREWGEIPGFALVGAAALSTSVTFVGLMQPPPPNCAGGDCQQGEGLGWILIFLASFLIFLVTISAGRILARRFPAGRWRRGVR